MSQRTKAFEKYVYDTTLWLSKRGIEVITHLDGNIVGDDGHSMSGEFDGFKRTITIGNLENNADWLTTFIHEKSHAKQFLTRKPCWMNVCDFYKGEDAGSIVFNWINGKEYKQKVIEKAIVAVRDMELDCEKMVVKELYKHNLDKFINVKRYIQHANSYVYFYNMILVTRKWYGENNEGENACRLLMPTHFNNNYNTIPLDFYSTTMKHCYK